MPIIKVWCLPKRGERTLKELFQSIVHAVVGVEELGLRGKEDLTVLFPPDQMKYGLGSDIIVEVAGLFEKPERTPEVRQRLAENLGKSVAKHFPKAKVECLVYGFDPAQGFWTSTAQRRKVKLSEFGKKHGAIVVPIDTDGGQVPLTEEEKETIAEFDIEVEVESGNLPLQAYLMNGSSRQLAIFPRSGTLVVHGGEKRANYDMRYFENGDRMIAVSLTPCRV
jgi:hypothetical protein